MSAPFESGSDERTARSSRHIALIGRETELAALGGLLAKRWHVTVVGTAGVGKSRLAAEVLRRRGVDFLFCDLTEAVDADDVLDAMARVLAVEPGEGRAVDRIAAVLAAKGSSYLLLDGVDRLSATAWDQTISRFLDAAPELHVVATARARLRVEGEAVFPLGPLDISTAHGESPAEELFLGLAESVIGRDLREHGAVPDGVRALVRMLDGLPLALEIAASVIHVLSPYEFLQRGALLLDAPAPGKSWGGGSLRAAFEVSWERLSADARHALQSFAVFVGDFDLKAAEALVGPRAFDLLARLCEASLVAAAVRDEKTRFHIFECVRQFAFDRDDSPKTVATARGRHAAYFGAEGATWARKGESRDRLEALERLTAEESNLVAVAEHIADKNAPSEDEISHGAGAMAALAWLWLGRGSFEPHLRLLGRMQSLVRPHVLRDSTEIATFQLTLVNIWRHRGDLDRALPILEDALERARHLGDPYLQARCLLERARLARLRGDREMAARSIAEASTLADPNDDDLIRLHVLLSKRIVASLDEPSLLEASRLAQRVGDPLATARVELAFATFCYAMGRPDEALEHVALVNEAAARLHQHTWRGLAALVAGNALAEQGRPDEARAMFETTLRIGLLTAHRRTEAEARANIALLDFEAGRSNEATEGLLEATNLFAKRDPMRLYFMAAIAGVEASHPARADGAVERFFAARNEALRVAPSLAVEIDRFGEMFQLRGAVVEPSAHDPGPPTTAALSASRVARRVCKSVRARLNQHAFVIASDGTWFEPPGADRVSLAPRPVLSGLVRVLSRAHLAAPGAVVSREDLVRAIWPDERSSRGSMGNRLSVALSTLRTLGLKAIVATPRGVSFEPSVRIEGSPVTSE